ncbi:MAG: cyclic nucleotide-binding domain-containing protein, partial [Burkholderiaceae bacterium]
MDQPPTFVAPAPGQQPDPNRAYQMFPLLDAVDIQRVQRFGEARTFADGAFLIQAGEKSRGLFLLVKGGVSVVQRDGLGRRVPYHDYAPGEFLAEAGTL